MSKKVFHSRLESLFTDLRLDSIVQPVDQPPVHTGWTWECDSGGMYTSCSLEVKAILGYTPQELIGQPFTRFALTPNSSSRLESALSRRQFPLEQFLDFLSAKGETISVAFFITAEKPVENGEIQLGYRGFAQVLSSKHPETETPEPVQETPLPPVIPSQPEPTSSLPLEQMPAMHLAEDKSDNGRGAQTVQADMPSSLTTVAPEIIKDKKPIVQDASEGKPAWMAVPLNYGGDSSMLFELLDDTPGKQWSDDERMLVEQVVDQLSLALENAQLFQQTRTALSETEARAKELAVLNEMSRAFAFNLEVQSALEIIYRYTSQLMNTDNFYVAFYDSETDTISFPLVYADGQLVDENHPEKTDWTSGESLGGLTGHVIRNKRPLLVEENVRSVLQSQDIQFVEVGSGKAESWLGVPMMIGDRVIGIISVQSETQPHLYDEHHAALMTTIANQAAIAIENARLFEQTQQALSETEALYQTSARINTAQSLVEILNALFSHTILGKADINTTINIFDHPWTTNQTPEWVIVIASQKIEQVGTVSARFSDQSFPSASLFLQPSTPTIIHDVQNDNRLSVDFRNLLSQNGQANCVLLCPLIAAGRWIGFINGMYSQQLEFPENEIRRLMALVNQASIAIQNNRLLEETRRRADQLQTASEIARDTSSTLALDALLKRSVNLLRDRFGFYHASVFLLDEEGKYAVVRESTGEAGEEMKRSSHRLAVGSQSIIGYVTQTGEPLVVNDVSQNPVYHINPLLPNTHSELGIALEIGEKVIGALDVQSTEVNAFRPDDVTTLQILADQIAVAIDNATAYELSQKAVEEMRKADQLKSQFLANMSHELRTPLNSIIGFSRVILKGIDGPTTDLQQQDLSAIYNSGLHLLNLINDILDLSKIEAGKMELAFEDDVDLAELIQSVMATLTALVKNKPINIEKDIAADLPHVRADSTKVRQIMLNLLSNAAKFTDQGFIHIQATTQTGPEDQPEVIVKVTDSGPGIAPAEMSKLFLPFSQVDASPTRKTGGSGLGLSITRHLVEMHGGQIGLTSEVGKGSTFYFTLPLHPVVTAEKPSSDELIETMDTMPVILAIDNEPQVLKIYQRYLSANGYKIIPLTDPTIALETAKLLQPFAITLDVTIQATSHPDYDGWKVLLDLKADPETRDIPVIVCTILNEREKARSLGAAEYMMKPFLEEDLTSALERVKH